MQDIWIIGKNSKKTSLKLFTAGYPCPICGEVSHGSDALATHLDTHSPGKKFKCPLCPPEFEDATQKVTFKVEVNEGPQYRMGTVEFKGFTSDDAATLSKRWGLKSGEVYDRSYTTRFFRDQAREITTRITNERQLQGKPLPNIDTEEKPDRQASIVNLLIELKN